MVDVILFDCDGPIIRREKYFSQRLKEQGQGVNEAKVRDFFKTEFLQIERGRADLKEILSKLIPEWEYKGTAEELMDFWFSGEAEVNLNMKEYILKLKDSGVKAYLATNNEKYRTEYLWNVVGIKSFLDGLFSSCYLGYMKPEVEYWREIYKVLNKFPKENILVLDDKQAAIDSALAFGFKAELYTTLEDFKKVMVEKNKI